ncbi:MAG: AAA family ATPase [Nocardioidaceae bacterium]
MPDLIPEGMSLLVGGPKIGKSWLAFDVALAVAAGGVVLGRVPVGSSRPVLMLALADGDRRLQDRARELLNGDPIPPSLAYLTRIEPGHAVETVEAWLATLPADETPLVIIDTLGRVMPPALLGESSYQRDYRVASRLKRICDDHPGMALLVLHHDRKAQSEDFVDGVSGTNGLAGAADTLIVIARPRTEQRGLFKVTGRDVAEREYAVTVEHGHWSLIGDDLVSAAANAQTIHATANLSDRSAEIVRYVARHPDGVRAKDVAEAVDLSGREAGVYLSRLLDAGRLCRPERGLYMPVESVKSVVSSNDGTPGYSTFNTFNTPTEGTCAVCGLSLIDALVEAGETTHPTCGEPR